jgi:amino acid adenylation domain-containing protein
MLVESLANPEAGLYVEQIVLEMRGAVSMRALSEAWRALVERHAALRTSFHWRDMERPVQAVHQAVTVPVSHKDLGRLPPERREAAVAWFLDEDRRRGFRFDRAPLLRVAVLRLGPGAHRLVVTLHHILVDGWSLGILMAELSLLYRGAVEGIPVHLERPPPFELYIAWLRERDPEAAEAYWRGALGDHAGAPPLSRLTGAGEAGARGHAYAELDEPVPGALDERLRRMARDRRITLNTAVLGAWGILLAGELGTDDLVVGAVVSGREAPVAGIDRVVGLCINTVPVRLRIAPERPVGEWLDGLQAQQVEMRDVQHHPLTEVHGWSGVPRGRPLFESIFIFENHAARPPGGPMRPASGRAFERTSSPLTVLVGVVPRLSLKLLHDRSVVETEAARRLMTRLVGLLDGIARDPSRAIGDLPRLDDEERRRVLALGEGSSVPLPDELAHELLARRAAAAPEALALIDGARRVTMGELDARADALAGRMRAAGAGRGAIVGVALERSAEAVEAMLAAMKAGAAYLPLEPSTPPERLRLMLADSGASVAVTTTPLAAGLPPTSARLLLLDAGDEAPGEPPAAPPEGRPAPSDPAWVLYTSGSTGTPKGVMGSHRGLANRLWWGWRAEPFGPDEVCLGKTRLGFVDSVWELFGPLCAGRPVVLVDEATAADPRALAEAIVAHGVTRLVAVPSLLAVLFDLAGERLAGSRLRHVTSSGEPLGAEVVRRVRAALPGCRILNLYGSTEVAADATAFALDGPPAEPVPIGRPLDNVWVRVLDPAGELVPVGVVGEIYVGGAGVTPGYVGAAGAGAERLVADPLAPGGGPLYRTGDLGRWRPDGQLEFAGRADRQVKVRGVRVEPGEVEHALERHRSVREAAVVARPGPEGTELVGFVVGTGPEAGPEALAAHLRGLLPDQLVPAHLIAVEELPRLPSGKIDRAALAARGERTAPAKADEPAATPEEQAVAAVFAELTGADHVGRHDDFFALGGHSLLATRAAARLGERLDREVPLRLLFERPTVAELAAAIAAIPPGRLDEAVPLAPLERERFHDGSHPHGDGR